MTTDSIPADSDPRRLLSDVRTLAHRVRLDQRVTWVALLVLAVVALVAIPVGWLFLYADCGRAFAEGGSGACRLRGLSRGFYWLPALLLAYTAIALYAVRVTRARGLGARVLPYVLTGVALAVLSAVVWLLAFVYWQSQPLPTAPPTEPLPSWVMLLDRLVAPVGTIGVALLVLAWLERHVALLLFTLGYLALVLVPIDTFRIPRFLGHHPDLLLPQAIGGAALLLGAVGFAVARRWQR
ncbi:hypothetical protein [Plantactinospora soyae]|uniref:Uncharacterized protein n=1 Tax=Plantactinospora soyae TaxID=1544732 RepID=A0A927QZS3_9ACTN|nr:hypothetical protein [Plantactinospora soyae]MBE1490740.1 hypothetical protein [Plantactinospora soyae]